MQQTPMILGLVSLLASVSAAGDCPTIHRCQTVKGIDYVQTLDGVQPTVPAFFYADSRVAMPGQTASTVGVVTPSGMYTMHDDGGGNWETALDFTSATEIEIAFPAGSTLQFVTTGGSVSGRSQPLPMGPADYPAVPYLTGCGYSDLQDANPAFPVRVQWSGPDENTTSIAIGIYTDDLVDGEILEVELDKSDRSFTIPAGVLLDGIEHEFILEFRNTREFKGDDCPGFGVDSTAISAHSSGVSVFFTPSVLNPGACPADLNCDGTLDFFDLSLFLSGQLDWDSNTSFDFFDLSSYLSEFGAGCP